MAVALIAAIISGFAIGYGLEAALGRNIPVLTERLRSLERFRWAVIWRSALALIFTVVTCGCGIIGLLCGWAVYLTKRKRKERTDNFIALLQNSREKS